MRRQGPVTVVLKHPVKEGQKGKLSAATQSLAIHRYLNTAPRFLEYAFSTSLLPASFPMRSADAR
jgi:hypothetical protein